MHIEFLVEEESMEKALQNLIPKIVGEDVSFITHVFQGKTDLKNKLPTRLRAYSHYIKSDWCIVVLLDKDDEDCVTLKTELDKIANDAGLITHSDSKSKIQVLNRIAIEELEACFFGDVKAIAEAYPGVSLSLGNQAKYRNPDAITGGTWEALQRVLQTEGYYLAGMPKIEVARKISEHMEPKRNQSRSFQVFRDALTEMKDY